jgi:hypothetical protein
MGEYIGWNCCGWVICINNAAISNKEKNCSKKLIDIMGRTIQHRNIGKNKSFDNEILWVEEAKKIEEEAVKNAKQLSAGAGSFIEWLDKIDGHDGTQVGYYVSVLSKISDRIRDILKLDI